jgi:phosphoglycolate phosphatase
MRPRLARARANRCPVALATPVRTYLFDLDGTLIDHFEAIHRSYAYTLPRLGLPAPTPAEVRAAVGGGLENAMSRFVAPPKLAEALEIYRAYWHETMLDGVKAMPGALDLLAALAARGAKSAVLTNKLGSSSRRVCDQLGFSPYLGAVIGAGDTRWLKPERDLTLHTLALLGEGPGGALFIGDSPYDVESAHNAGIPCWAVTTGTHTEAQLRAAGADAVFDGLPALAASLG